MFIETFCHYLPMIKYFVNEYYMAAILHYMSYQSVMGNKQLTIQRFNKYIRRRNFIIILYKVFISIFTVTMFAANVVYMLKRYDGDLVKFKNNENEFGVGTPAIVLEAVFIVLRSALSCVFFAAMIRMTKAKSNAKKIGQEHTIPLPKFCSIP